MSKSENNVLKWNMVSACVGTSHGPVFKILCLTPVHLTGQGPNFFLDVKLNWSWKGRMKCYFCSDSDYGKSKTVLFQYYSNQWWIKPGQFTDRLFVHSWWGPRTNHSQKCPSVYPVGTGGARIGWHRGCWSSYGWFHLALERPGYGITSTKCRPHHSGFQSSELHSPWAGEGPLFLHKASNLWNLYCLAQAHSVLILPSTWYIRKNRKKLLPGKYTV